MESWYCRIAASSFLVFNLVLAVVPSHPMAAAETRASDDAVFVKSEETVADDLYAFSPKVTIDGTIQGDLIAVGREIVINGTVEGDVLAFGEQVHVNGAVHGDVMGAGRAVVIAGSVDDARIAGYVLKVGPKAKLGGSILAAGFSLETEKGSAVSGDALYAGFQALLGGQIGKDIQGGLVNCRMTGKVGGDIELDVGGEESSSAPPSFGLAPPVPLPAVPGGLTIAETAEVIGKLNYASKQPARIAEGARLTGGVEHHQPDEKATSGQSANRQPPDPVLAAILTNLRHGLCVALVGIAAVVCFPRWTSDWADNIRTRPGASFLGGLAGVAAFAGLVFLVVVVVILAALLALALTLHELVPMIIVGGIVSYAAMVVFMSLTFQFLGEAVVGLAVGRLAMRAENLSVRVGALVLGVVAVTLILSIPLAGPWLWYVVFLLGLGGYCLWLVGYIPTDQVFNCGPHPGKS